MARNEVYPLGRQLATVPTFPATPAAGDPVIVGFIAGVALEAKRAADGLTAVKFDGVFNLTVSTEAAIGDVIAGTQASPVVLSATEGESGVAGVAGGSIVFGVALAAQAGAGIIPVRLGR